MDRAGAPAQAQLSEGAPEEGPPSFATSLLGGSREGDCSNSTIAILETVFSTVLFHTAVIILIVLNNNFSKIKKHTLVSHNS